jgi:hypothetical protein
MFRGAAPLGLPYGVARRFAGSLRSAGGPRFARPSLGATSRVLIERQGVVGMVRAGGGSASEAQR